MTKLILLDAYAIIYRSYYALLGTPRINSKGLNTSAIMGFCNTLHEVLTKEQPDYIGVAFDHGKTFRHEKFPAYKAQRQETPEDIKRSVPIIQDILGALRIPVLQKDGFEADDVIGTLAHQADEMGILTYMLTPDKDYGQLIADNVKMYKPRHGGGYDIIGKEEVQQKYGIATPAQVIDLLALMGDSADNFPGCPGVGEKTAVKLINQFGSVANLLESTDQLKGKMKEKVINATEDIKLSYFLATIRQDVPISLDLEVMKCKEPDAETLAKLFDELEFKTLTNKFLGKAEKTKKKSQRQLDLFAEITPDGQEETKNEQYESIKTTQHEYHLVDNVDDALSLYDFLRTKEILCLDTETTSVHPMEAELVGFSFAVKEKEAWYIAVKDNRKEALKMLSIFKPLFEDEKILKVGQNIKYDMEVLMNYGVRLAAPMFDTMLAHYVLQPEQKHNTETIAETLHQYNVLKPRLKETGVEDLFYNIEMPLVPVLAEMEMTGVRLDTDALAETSKVLTERMHQIEQSIYGLAGHEFNIASPKQVGEVLFGEMKIVEKPKKTKTGQYVTSEEVLQQLRSKAPIVDHILEHRGLKKLLGTYVDALPKLINPRTGHIHTTFNQAVTATGRLSSSNPNLQNIPVRGEDGKEIRKCFIPEPGQLFFSADYSQIELRVMAHLSGDKNMIEAFREGYDIHAATAARIYKEDINSVSRDQRTKAKRANFGIIYGITVFGLAERLDISRDEAKQLIEGYFNTFPGVHAYMEKAKETAREHGYAETFFHRRRYLPDITSHNATVRNFAERNAINAPIQGSAADIIKIAMVRIYERFQREGIRSKMILQVHDELNFSVLPEEKERVEKIVIEEMQNAYPLHVPLVADSGWGENWLEAH